MLIRNRFSMLKRKYFNANLVLINVHRFWLYLSKILNQTTDMYLYIFFNTVIYICSLGTLDNLVFFQNVYLGLSTWIVIRPIYVQDENKNCTCHPKAIYVRKY